jgi:hypothetical protein
MYGSDFLRNVGAICGKLGGDIEELAGDDVADSADDDESHDTCNCDREDSGNAPGFQTADCGG